MAPVTFFDGKYKLLYAELELALTFTRTCGGRRKDFIKIRPTPTKLQRLKHQTGEFGHNSFEKL